MKFAHNDIVIREDGKRFTFFHRQRTGLQALGTFASVKEGIDSILEGMSGEHPDEHPEIAEPLEEIRDEAASLGWNWDKICEKFEAR